MTAQELANILLDVERAGRFNRIVESGEIKVGMRIEMRHLVLLCFHKGVTTQAAFLFDDLIQMKAPREVLISRIETMRASIRAALDV